MKILTSDGNYVAAGDLKLGMKVRTLHEIKLEYGDYEVTYHEIFNSKRLCIKFNHIDFICSYSHKFYKDGLWIEACDLKQGDAINDYNILEVSNYEDGPVVKIIIEDAHTYICEYLLSHNKSPPTTPTATLPIPTGTSYGPGFINRRTYSNLEDLNYKKPN